MLHCNLRLGLAELAVSLTCAHDIIFRLSLGIGLDQLSVTLGLKI